MDGVRDRGSGIRDEVAKDSGSRVPDPGSPNWDNMALVGRIARPHGLRGDVVVNPETDFVEQRFRPGATVWTRVAGRDEELTIVSARVVGGRPVLGFEGWSTIEAVERLAGRELRVPEEALQPLEPGRYYEHELVGCLVRTGTGDTVGKVVRVESGAGVSRLVIDGAGGEILVPLAAHICVEIDVAARTIRIEPPDGLLELNAK
jgi:16S rRNA processing protein RimM